jgi:hypothetical protein
MDAPTPARPAQRHARRVLSRALQLLAAAAIVVLYLLVLSRGHFPPHLPDFSH